MIAKCSIEPLITKWSSFGNESVIPILYTVSKYE